MHDDDYLNDDYFSPYIDTSERGDALEDAIDELSFLSNVQESGITLDDIYNVMRIHNIVDDVDRDLLVSMYIDDIK